MLIEPKRKSDDQNEELWKKKTSSRIVRIEILIFILLILLCAIFFHNSNSIGEASRRDIEESIMTKIDARIEMIAQEYARSKLLSERDTRDSTSKILKGVNDSLLSPKDINSSTQTPLNEILNGAGKLTKDTPSRPSFTKSSTNDRNLIGLEPGPFAKKKMQRVRKDQELATCNGTEFHIDISLDNSAHETFWKLVNKETNKTEASQTYGDVDNNVERSRTKCIEPGPYKFSLYDHGGNGINCVNGKACYNISIDNKLLIEGKPFNKETEHHFDSSSSCLDEAAFLLTIQSDHILPNLNLRLRDETEKILNLEEEKGQFNVSFSTCIPVGLYTIIIEDNSGKKYSCSSFLGCNLFIDNEVVYEGSDMTNLFFAFSISNSRVLKKRACYNAPVLSPLNRIDNYVYDERLGKILEVIYALSSLSTLNDQNSPQYRAACWIIYDDALNLSPNDEMFITRYVIAVLLYAMNQNAELLLPLDLCEYDTITCNMKGHVSKIDVSNHDVEGFIPSELSHLISLEVLNMNKNRLRGKIPPEFSRLRNLETLNLAENFLVDTIPHSIGLLFNLKILSLSSNLLNGNIPKEIGSCADLVFIDLYDNDFSGTIPSEIFDLSSLQYLRLTSNKINGTVPSNIGQLHKLQKVFLANNLLTGPIPTQIGKLTELKRIVITKNNFIGTIPEEFQELIDLEGLLVDENKLNGTIPDGFANLTKLRRFKVSDNELSGSIPESFFYMDSIEWFIAHSNNLNAQIPEYFCANNPLTSFDDSPWFHNNPNVNCTCCKKPYCHLWNTKIPNLGGAQRPECPDKHKHEVDINRNITIWDTIANVSHFESVEEQNIVQSDMCLSPTGCYVLQDKTKLMYSSREKFLTSQDSCDAVDLCGETFHATHSKRLGLNHLTQLIPDFSFAAADSALCWILTEDELFEQFDVCDGTLLQRYVLAVFFRKQEKYTFSNFEKKETCSWPGVTCDSSGKFVEYLELQQTKSHESLNENCRKDDICKLDGTLISELGFLASLRRLNLTGNAFEGTVDATIFHHLPYLEVLDLANNKFGGEVPSLLFELDQLRKLDLQGNFFIGSLPDNGPYSKSLEHLNLNKNLLRGKIPNAIFESGRLIHVDLSKNFFAGSISSRIGELENLKEIDFGNNRLTGSIPKEIFKIKKLEVLKLQGNILTGTISSAIQNLHNVTTITLNHNLLKGEIPTELENLTRVEFLHLESNSFIGTAPEITFVNPDRNNSYVTDCGKSTLECSKCNICCTQEGMCNTNNENFWVMGETLVSLLTIPCILSALIFILFLCEKRNIVSVASRDPLDIYKKESVYCFIFSKDFKAAFLSVAIAFVQVMLLMLFLRKSKFSTTNSLRIPNVQCTAESLTCVDLIRVNAFGETLFHVLVILYLGSDFMNGMLQIRFAVSLRDLKLFCYGFIVIGLTTFSYWTSWRYNQATANDNTDLIMNAVVLLFINDLDEQVESLLEKICPQWTNDRLDEVEERLKRKDEDPEQNKEEIDDENYEFQSASLES